MSAVLHPTSASGAEQRKWSFLTLWLISGRNKKEYLQQYYYHMIRKSTTAPRTAVVKRVGSPFCRAHRCHVYCCIRSAADAPMYSVCDIYVFLHVALSPYLRGIDVARKPIPIRWNKKQHTYFINQVLMLLHVLESCVTKPLFPLRPAGFSISHVHLHGICHFLGYTHTTKFLYLSGPQCSTRYQ